MVIKLETVRKKNDHITLKFSVQGSSHVDNQIITFQYNANAKGDGSMENIETHVVKALREVKKQMERELLNLDKFRDALDASDYVHIDVKQD